MSAPFRLTLWTADAALAARADAAGVDRIGVDLDRLGKAERQAGLGSWISPHTDADLARVGAVLRRAQCFVRIDPLNPDTPRQIERVLTFGAQVVMLPMARSAGEIACVVDLLAGRAELVPLLECAAGLRAITELGALGIAEAHVGLNDLALSLGVTDRFAALLSDELATAVAQAQRARLPLGIGGIGRAGDNTLPIPSRLVYAEQARLHSAGALLSRAFFFGDDVDVAAGVAAARAEIDRWRRAPPAALAAAHDDLAGRIATRYGRAAIARNGGVEKLLAGGSL